MNNPDNLPQFSYRKNDHFAQILKDKYGQQPRTAATDERFRRLAQEFLEKYPGGRYCPQSHPPDKVHHTPLPEQDQIWKEICNTMGWPIEPAAEEEVTK